MGSDSEFRIPVIEFATGSPALTRGTEEWHHLCRRVREACENHGFFKVVYDKIPVQLREKTFSIIKELFDLPLEAKKKNVNSKPFHGYFGQYASVPLYESFGFPDASNFKSLESSVGLMWPDGNYHLCHTTNAMVKQLNQLESQIEMMILDSYGLGQDYCSTMECKTLLRVMKYRSPPSGERMAGLYPHTDKMASVILFEDQVSGLEVETRGGQWNVLDSLHPSSFIFIVGDALMAWSNCRMHAAKHKVMMSGDKDRYSFGLFFVPVEGTIIKPPMKLVDEDHPQVLKEFDYDEFIKFSISKGGADSEKQVLQYAGKSTQQN